MAEAASSIGRIGEPYFDRHNNRIKGFYADIITDSRQAPTLIRGARALMERSDATRMTLRFVTAPGVEIPHEALIPLEGRWSGHNISYYGENSGERSSPAGIVKMQKNLVSWAMRNRRSYDAMRLAQERGYAIDTSRISSSEDMERLVYLYSQAYASNGNGVRYTFGINEDSIRSLAGNPDAITAVARNRDGRIVSITVAETTRIPTGDGDLMICELSDEATLREHRNLGLVQACVQALSSQLYGSMGTDAIYAESRASIIGANKNVANAGFAHAGLLQKHCVMGGDKDVPEQGPYENLNVWYLPRGLHGAR